MMPQMSSIHLIATTRPTSNWIKVKLEESNMTAILGGLLSVLPGLIQKGMSLFTGAEQLFQDAKVGRDPRKEDLARLQEETRKLGEALITASEAMNFEHSEFAKDKLKFDEALNRIING